MRLELTRRADYAIRIMVDLAISDPTRPRSARRIAEHMTIPKLFVAQVMRDLVGAGFVTATAGRHGGYQLARPADSIDLLAIIEAAEGDARRLECVLRQSPCGRDGYCVVHDVFARAQDKLLDELASSTIADTAQELAAAGVQTA